MSALIHSLSIVKGSSLVFVISTCEVVGEYWGSPSSDLYMGIDNSGLVVLSNPLMSKFMVDLDTDLLEGSDLMV